MGRAPLTGVPCPSSPTTTAAGCDPVPVGLIPQRAAAAPPPRRRRRSRQREQGGRAKKSKTARFLRRWKTGSSRRARARTRKGSRSERCQESQEWLVGGRGEPRDQGLAARACRRRASKLAAPGFLPGPRKIEASWSRSPAMRRIHHGPRASTARPAALRRAGASVSAVGAARWVMSEARADVVRGRRYVGPRRLGAAWAGSRWSDRGRSPDGTRPTALALRREGCLRRPDAAGAGRHYLVQGRPVPGGDRRRRPRAARRRVGIAPGPCRSWSAAAMAALGQTRRRRGFASATAATPGHHIQRPRDQDEMERRLEAAPHRTLRAGRVDTDGLGDFRASDIVTRRSGGRSAS